MDHCFRHRLVVVFSGKFHDDVIKWKHFACCWPLVWGNSPVTSKFPSQRPVTRSFDVFFDLRLNKRMSKQSCSWWFETSSCALWRHCNVPDALRNDTSISSGIGAEISKHVGCVANTFYFLNNRTQIVEYYTLKFPTWMNTTDVYRLDETWIWDSTSCLKLKFTEEPIIGTKDMSYVASSIANMFRANSCRNIICNVEKCQLLFGTFIQKLHYCGVIAKCDESQLQPIDQIVRYLGFYATALQSILRCVAARINFMLCISCEIEPLTRLFIWHDIEVRNELFLCHNARI